MISLRTATGTGGVPHIGGHGMSVLADEMLEGVYSIEVKYFADAPDVPLITVVAESEERALSVYEALRATVSGLELFPAPSTREIPVCP